MKQNVHKLADFQQEFSDLIRHPSLMPSAINAEDRRLKIYRELFFNNVEGFAAGAFPVLKDILGAERWNELVSDFFKKHIAKTPLFLEISEEFMTYLSERTFDDLPFLNDLAHWEWMELHADVSDTLDEPTVLTHINLEDTFAIRDCAWGVAYEWPVHQISADYLPSEPSATFLMVYRKLDWHVGFIELNPMSYLLFESFKANADSTASALLSSLADAHGLDLDAIQGPALDVLNQWRQLGLIKLLGM